MSSDTRTNLGDSLVKLLFLLTVSSFVVRLSFAGFACLENPCAHGICMDDIKGPHQCYCQNGFTGYSCEQNWDECRSWGVSPCLNGGMCTDLIADFNCSCVEPFTGKKCEINLSECDEIFPCQNNGTCVHDARESTHHTGLLCRCPLGFKGDHCEEDVSMCNTTSNACQNGGKCIDDIGKNYYCVCEPGWTGHYCEVSIDECSSDPCQNGGICVDKIADYSCACPAGYTGKSCETKMKICPADEDPCLNGALCLEEVDKKQQDLQVKISHVCYCFPDFHGKLCEERYDECDQPTTCLNGGSCVDGVGTFFCTCPSEFYGRTCECSINVPEIENPPECSEIPHPHFNLTSSTSTPETRTDVIINASLSSSLLLLPDRTSVMMVSPTEQLLSSPYLPPAPATSTIVLLPTTILIMSSDSPYDPGGLFPSTTILVVSSSLPFLSSVQIDTPVDSIDATAMIEGRRRSSDLYLDAVSTSGIMMLTPVVKTPSPSPSPTLITTFVEETATLEDTSYEPCPSLSVGEVEPETMDKSSSISIPSSSIYITPSVIFSSLPPPFFSSSIKDLIFESEKVAVSSVSSSLYSSVYSQDSNELITEFPPDFEGVITTSTVKVPIPTSILLFDSESLWEIPDSSEFMSISSTRVFPSSELFVTSTPLYFTPILSSIPSSSLGQSQSQSSWTLETPTKEKDLTLIISERTAGFYTTPHLELTPTPTLPYGESSTLSPLLSPSLLPSVSTMIVEDLISATSRTTQQEQEQSIMISSTAKEFYPVSSTPTPLESVTPVPVPSSTIVSSEEMISVVPTATLLPSPSPSQTAPSPTQSMMITPLPSPLPSSSSSTTIPSNLTDPCENYCQNNAECISINIEPTCICPFRFYGAQCEYRQEDIQIPSFSGNSFMKYELPRASANIIDISAQMATVFPEGILMYSTIGKIYALLYIQNGLVTLHFSCGAQSMHFVETRTRVDNGYNFTLSFRLENVLHGNDELRCVGQVSLNESYSMQGEQIVDMSALSVLEQPIKKVFLGGVDSPDLHLTDEIIRILPGFRGCVYRLRVNEELLSMFNDAKDGREIFECSTFGCVINPCAGHSRCVSSNKYPFWQCRCPPGFEGRRCNIGICTVNPCKNGATCTTMPIHNTSQHLRFGNESSLTSLCLCPLGYTGARCQTRLKVTKPAFRPTPDYSSFVLYELAIPRFPDWIQLKFHFITRNMSQIALLLYQGGENSVQIKSRLRSYSQQTADFQDNDPASDFFFISFIHGFIALTWNLGSGTQRITTPSRIDNRLNVHVVTAGRRGRQAWLQVDGMRNTTGKTPGSFYQLDANSDVYIGGHEIPRFEGLPNDIPLHVGFEGCIFDLGFRDKNKLFLPRPIRGRNINNCYEDC